ncbi:LAMI_0G02256g1_1 [Lachancea mirantina]|uniref:LAMI_0G02256g1_1 n=1 Tax=Lachancea mirantina TaxID=1230905 RepID=A0A1G4K7Q1_9SACH|nr:LAMI_0G02256g1_1 [Lachancea mirantina]
MKFGKFLESRQLELPEYNGHFIAYKSLKKLIKQLSVPVALPATATPGATASKSAGCDVGCDVAADGNVSPVPDSGVYRVLQEHKASFFFRLERELEKVNEYYLGKESDLRIKFDVLHSWYEDGVKRGKLASKQAVSYRNLRDGIKKFERDLAHLEQFVELNRTGFSKVLKKWDKRSHSHTKDFYLATVVSVQPVFSRNEISRLNDAALAMLMELNDISSDERASFFHRDSSASASVATFVGPAAPVRPASRPELEWARPEAVRDVVRSTGSVSGSISVALPARLYDIDTEIEIWFLELLSIAKLKDQQPRFDHLRSFADQRVQSFVETNFGDETVDRTVVVRDAITKIFTLLVSSSVDDESVCVFMHHAVANIDLSLAADEHDMVFARRNIFHEAAMCATESRLFVLDEALRQVQEGQLSRDVLRKLLNAQDSHGRIPLHYASELGKISFVTTLIRASLLDSVDVLDNDSKTSLVLAIGANKIDVCRALLFEAHAAPLPSFDEDSKPQFNPLNVACAHNNYDAADMLLSLGQADLSTTQDSQGLCPLHIVAKNGANADLVNLLISHGADTNGVDGFNKWTPIFYAVQEGHASTVEQLLNNGAIMDIYDDDNLSPLFHALWEGHLGVINLLRRYVSLPQGQIKDKPHVTIGSPFQVDDDLSASGSLIEIPDFTLPPPIIPLRKYGHNFLEKKIFVEIILKSGLGSVVLNKDDESVLSTPGRITLTSNVADIIPRNVILPIDEDDERIVVFQVDSISNFSVDFEIFPSFGTRLIAKTTALPQLFQSKEIDSSNRGQLSLALFDSRVKNVGELAIDFRVIFPYAGKPLEVSKYETYWKSTAGNDMGSSRNQFVTSSSLSGSYLKLSAGPSNDGLLIVSSEQTVNINGAKLKLTDLNSIQLEQLLGYSLSDLPDIQNEQQLLELLDSRVFYLSAILAKLPADVHLEIEVRYPTCCEIESIPLTLSSLVDLNKFIDDILLTLFTHVRRLFREGKTTSIVFTSCNPEVCSILNWKQPNFPVLFQVSGWRSVGDKFLKDTPHHLSNLSLDPTKIDYSDPCARCIREATQFACHNNLLGIVIPFNLLRMSNELISQIRARGLLLVGSVPNEDLETKLQWTNYEINGCKTRTQLEIKGDT